MPEASVGVALLPRWRVTAGAESLTEGEDILGRLADAESRLPRLSARHSPHHHCVGSRAL
jgi:hypothetical protein